MTANLGEDLDFQLPSKTLAEKGRFN